jgi:hypothetical protein
MGSHSDLLPRWVQFRVFGDGRDEDNQKWIRSCFQRDYGWVTKRVMCYPEAPCSEYLRWSRFGAPDLAIDFLLANHLTCDH